MSWVFSIIGWVWVKNVFNLVMRELICDKFYLKRMWGGCIRMCISIGGMLGWSCKVKYIVVLCDMGENFMLSYLFFFIWIIFIFVKYFIS